jgi:hypothetical protein
MGSRRRVTRIRRRRVVLPAELLAELVPTRPTPVPVQVYTQGPTAQAMGRSVVPEGFVVATVVGDDDERHAVEAQTLPDIRRTVVRSVCDRVVSELFPKASLLIVECPACQQPLLFPDSYS